MTRRLSLVSSLVLLATLIFPAALRAENKGQADLDKATEIKLNAESLSDLTEVIKLCQSAIKNGLDEANTEFANRLLSGTLLQRAEVIVEEIFGRPTPPARWPQLRDMALTDLERCIKIDDTAAEAHYLVGRLQGLPGGDPKRALKALDAAVKHGADEPGLLAKALIMRANLSDDPASREADYNSAAKLAPGNVEVLRTRGMFRLMQNQFEEALTDLDAAIELDPKNADLHEARGVALFLQKKYDESLKSFDKASELAPDSAVPYLHRARIFAINGDTDKSLAELEKALKIEPRSSAALLLRARVYQQANEGDKALADVEQALQLQPESSEGLQLHALLVAGSGSFDRAIEDLEHLKKLAPDNGPLLLQLGAFYSADKKPQKAIDAFSDAIRVDDKNWMAYRGRADAYLSLGKQADAVADYEAALKIEPENSGVLNNLAWVLATSPEDKLRDAKRSIELAIEACKLTEYKQAHILSTLAAGYAEKGDFEKAIEWSEKAVALGGDGLKGQLSKELDSYKAHKPWREDHPGDALIVDESEDAPKETAQRKSKTVE